MKGIGCQRMGRVALIALVLVGLVLAGCGGGGDNPLVPPRFDDGNNSIAEADPLDESGNATAVLTLSRGDTTDFFGPLTWSGGTVMVRVTVSNQNSDPLPGRVLVSLFTSLAGRGGAPGETIRSFRFLGGDQAGYGEFVFPEGSTQGQVTIELGYLGGEFAGNLWLGVAFLDTDKVTTDMADLTFNLAMEITPQERGTTLELEPNNQLTQAFAFVPPATGGLVGAGDPSDWFAFTTLGGGVATVTANVQGDPVRVRLARPMPPSGTSLSQQGEELEVVAEESGSGEISLSAQLEAGTWFVEVAWLEGGSTGRSIYQLAISTPGGLGAADRRIAFVREGLGGRLDLFVVEPTGAGLSNLSETAEADEMGPGWSPAKQNLASWVLSDSGLGVLALDTPPSGGSTLSQQGSPQPIVVREGSFTLAEVEDAVANPPLLSADGNTLFISYLGLESPELSLAQRVSVADGTVEPLFPQGQEGWVYELAELATTEDGSLRLAAVGFRPGFFPVDRQGLRSGESRAVAIDPAMGEVVASLSAADGGQILAADLAGEATELVALELSGDGQTLRVRRLNITAGSEEESTVSLSLTGGEEVLFGVLSPEGETLALLIGEPGTERGRILIYDLSGPAPLALGTVGEVALERPDFSPSGGELLFARPSSGELELWRAVIPAQAGDTIDQARIPNTAGVSAGQWAWR